MIPDLVHGLRNHNDVSRQHGVVPSAFESTHACLSALASAPLQCFFLGFRFIVHGARAVSVVAPPDLVAGSLYSDDGRVLLVTGDGVLEIESMEFLRVSTPLRTWADMCDALTVRPPYLITVTSYESLVFSNYFELLLHLRKSAVHRIVDGRVGHARPPSFDDDDDSDRGSWCPDALTEPNIAFMTDLMTTYALDTTHEAVLDIGCGNGFLASAMERAGARHPIGTDLRIFGASFYRRMNPHDQYTVLAVADMFHWCYAPKRYALIALRNNSALAKTRLLDARFSKLFADIAASLCDGGLLYGTVLTNDSGVFRELGFSNLPAQTFLTTMRESGLVAFRLMRLGSAFGFLAGRAEDAARLKDRCRAHAHAKRRHLFTAYEAQRFDLLPRDEGKVLPGFFLVLADLVSEVALEIYSGQYSGVAFEGLGMLSYCCWRILSNCYPDIRIHGFISERERPPKPPFLEVLTDAQARNYWSDALRVLTDMEACRRLADAIPQPDLAALRLFDAPPRPRPRATFTSSPAIKISPCRLSLRRPTSMAACTFSAARPPARQRTSSSRSAST